MQGGAGNDRLIADGFDQLEGGSGDDIYEISGAGNVIVELPGGGTDIVRTSTSMTLPDNVEELIIQGVSGLSAFGNGEPTHIAGCCCSVRHAKSSNSPVPHVLEDHCIEEW